MLKYYALCSGSKGNCFVFKNDEDIIMIDCGSTRKYLLEKLHEINVGLSDIDGLLITHTHSDHVSQIKTFKNNNIYSFANLEVPYHQIEAFKPFKIKSFDILALPLSHDAKNTVGYIIKASGKRVVYITDTGYVNKKYFDLIKDADYYILEFNHDINMLMKTSRPIYLKQRILGDSGHLCNEDAATVLRHVIGPHTKEVCLAHISQEANTLDLAYKAAYSVLKDTDIKITALKQFELFEGGLQDEEMVLDRNSIISNLEPCFNINSNK